MALTAYTDLGGEVESGADLGGRGGVWGGSGGGERWSLGWIWGGGRWSLGWIRENTRDRQSQAKEMAWLKAEEPLPGRSQGLIVQLEEK